MDATNDQTGFSLQEKVSVVTGAGQGLGLAIAKALQAAGSQVVVAELKEETGQAAAEEIGAEFIQVDVTDSSSVGELVQAVVERHGRIDVMVNGAGVAAHVPAEEMSDEEWRSTMSVNLDGVFWCCREAGKAMLERGSGAIVNIASMSGIISNRPQAQSHYKCFEGGGHHADQITRRRMGYQRSPCERGFARLHSYAAGARGSGGPRVG